ncbi:hypothetical protein CON65_02485 [Bacillus pseudomycoides]|uniref:Uncharacterized protein n=1 Tax=Bacillus pseudomycoides TaxID=64104 RepID=A0AA91VG10_9BACI|nr:MULTISPECIES: hypothetical protein [Bacillus]PED84321.1 hypothetical protein CON65_02485 [Bacillus pseudomycoides]PEU15848.1 hypothetical protein CN524_06190 [Bacillus sp. AFS019443]PEU19716.1 hypothetical protein CN525_06090 [Bacillus sp. AFS014408]PFW64852.1 hypothetical protein COL20_02370 [Bacillus sp. AFS075034]
MKENRTQEIKETAFHAPKNEDGHEITVIYKEDFEYLIRKCERYDKLVQQSLDEAFEEHYKEAVERGKKL